MENQAQATISTPLQVEREARAILARAMIAYKITEGSPAHIAYREACRALSAFSNALENARLAPKGVL